MVTHHEYGVLAIHRQWTQLKSRDPTLLVNEILAAWKKNESPKQRENEETKWLMKQNFNFKKIFI